VDVQIGGGVRVSDAFQAKLSWQAHSNMGTVVLCLNFPAWRSPIKRAPDKGNEMLADEVTIGNVELLNVLKTTD
jgi:hypothetical protein